MKTILLLIVGLSLSACAPKMNVAPVAVTPINSDLLPYIEEFKNLARSQGYDTQRFESIQLGMAFGKLNSGVVGYCETNMFQSQVTISQDWWYRPTFTETDKKALIAHELGHCLLFKGHQEEKEMVMGRLMPSSIMYPILLSQLFSSSEKDYLQNVLMPSKYLPELFHSRGTSMMSKSSMDDHTHDEPTETEHGSDFIIHR